jgi:hypothetical protein
MYSITIAIAVSADNEPLAERFVLAMAEYAEKLKEEDAFRGRLGAVVAAKCSFNEYKPSP